MSNLLNGIAMIKKQASPMIQPQTPEPYSQTGTKHQWDNGHNCQSVKAISYRILFLMYTGRVAAAGLAMTYISLLIFV